MPLKKWFLVLLVENGFFHRIVRKASEGPTHRRLERQNLFEMQNQRSSPSGSPVSHVCPSTIEKANLVCVKAKPKASAQSFCFILKLSPLEPTRSAAGPGGCSEVRTCMDEQASTGQRQTGRQRKNALSQGLYFPGLGENQALFKNNK